MINNILSAIFTFFFVGGMTKNTEDNVQHASWLKTIAYLVLTIIVSLFYLRTLKVETLLSYVDLRKSNAYNKEYAVIKINTVFDGVETDMCDYDDRLLDLDFGNNCSYWNKYRYFEGLFPVDSTGIFIRQITRKINRDGEKNKYINSFVSKSEGFGDIWHEYYKGVVDSFLLPFCKGQDVSKYSLICCIKRIPDFSLIKDISHFPFYQYTQKSKDNSTTQKIVVFPLERQRALKKFGVSDSILNIFGNRGMAFFMVNAIDNEVIANFSHSLDNIQSFYELQVKGDNLNSLNYFTAADISQCKFRLLLHSPMEIGKLTITFNTPVEFSELPFKVDKMNLYGFEVTDSATLSNLKSSNTLIHMKFPEMENKQLVRSLILTTLLTALASLFLYNFYYVLRKMFYRRRAGEDEVKITPMNNKIRIAHVLHNVLCLFSLAILLYFAIRIYNNNPYYITPRLVFFNLEFKWWLFLNICLFVVCWVSIEMLLYSWAYDKKKSEIDETQTKVKSEN